MTLAPGSWLGLPPLTLAEVPALRLVLVILALGAGALVARGARTTAAGVALGVPVLALLFWAGTLQRPYGLLVDERVTLALCDLAVAHAQGSSEQGCLFGVPPASPFHARLGAASGALGLPGDLALSLPTLVPALAFLAVGSALLLCGDRRDAHLLVFAWVAVCATQLDLAASAFGDLFRPWLRPAAFLILAPAIAGLLLTPGRSAFRRGFLASAVLGTLAAALVGGPPPTAGDAVRAVWAGPGLWAVLGWGGAIAGGGRRAFGLLAGSLVPLLLGVAGAPVSGEVAHHWHRLGLVFGVVALLERVLETARRGPGLGRLGEGHVEGLLVASLLAASPLVWWTPTRVDAIASASTVDESSRLVAQAAWIRAHLPQDAVFIASPEYAPAVGALTGRRVFRAPTLRGVPDDPRRLSIERRLLAQGLERTTAHHLGLSHVFVGPGDTTGPRSWLGRERPEAARLLRSSGGFSIYAVEWQWPPSPRGTSGEEGPELRLFSAGYRAPENGLESIHPLRR